MKVEILIYLYLAICAAMIFFNIACIFVFKYKDKRLDKYSDRFTNSIVEQMKKKEITQSHKSYLLIKLKKVNNLMAFDKTLSQMFESQPDEVYSYINNISSVFVDLTEKYIKKNTIQAAYFPYIIKKYGLFRGQENSTISNAMIELVNNPSLYCRENALLAIYSMGNSRLVINALKNLDRNEYYHNSKLISDGLLHFTGNWKELNELLWNNFNNFSLNMQLTILDYFRFSSDEHCKRMLLILKDEKSNDEIRYSCIRYFEKYHYNEAFDILIELAQSSNNGWEYSAIAASALANYPCDKSINTLKALLYSKDWYVRYNASMSLDRLGIDYVDLIDIFEGGDRYASEIMRYRFDQKLIAQRRNQQ